MRTLYIAINLILLIHSQLVSAEPKIEAINNIILTPCLTMRVDFNQEALTPYQTSKLLLKIEDIDKNKTYLEPIRKKDGFFSWEKAIPLAEKLTVTILKDNNPISEPYSLQPRTQLVSIVAKSMQLAKSKYSIIRDFEKTPVTVPIKKDLVNKELLAIVFNKYGKLLGQFYGVADKEEVIVQVRGDASYTETRVIASDTVCKDKL